MAFLGANEEFHFETIFAKRKPSSNQQFFNIRDLTVVAK
jgi:hypothetical protein